MIVEIYLRENSKPIVYENAINTFQNGDLFCVFYEFVDKEQWVDKYSLRDKNIQRIREKH